MKKHIVKPLSIALSILLIISTLILPTYATTPYPESDHDYQNNVTREWHYEYNDEATGLFVTFSEKTSFEKPTTTIIAPSKKDGIGSLVIGGTVNKKAGDTLTVAAKDYTLTATGTELSGKTLYIPDNSFKLVLKTDGSVTDYGFSIDRIDVTPPDDVAVVTYECCDACGEKKLLCYNQGEQIKVAHGYYCKKDGSAFVSWVDENGKAYKEGDILDFASVNLKAKRVPLLLESTEVLSFSNSDPYFDPDLDGGYYLSKADFLTMKKNIYKVFGPGVLPAVALSVAFSTYPDWYWNGSCYGMSTLAFLQHYGVIDALEGRDEKSISELTNEDSVLSMINYYQWSAAGSFLCENFALEKGSKMYSHQLKKLYESVADGNIVLFTYYPTGIFEESGHTVLLTGAYTESDGTKVLVAYDSNRPEDYVNQEFEQRYYIDADYTTIKRGYDYPTNWYMDVGAFNWTDDYAHFESFDINGDGSALTWYRHYFSQLFGKIRTLIELI